MKIRDFLMLGAISLSVGAACSEDQPADFTDAEMAKIRMLGPLPATAPPDPTNKYADNAAAATLGQMLFFDYDFSDSTITGAVVDDTYATNGGVGPVGATGLINCVSCHDPHNWYIDTRSKPGNVSNGIYWGGRNTPGLVNAAFYTWCGWGGRQDSVWQQNFGAGALFFVHTIYKKYKDEYNAIFPADEQMTAELEDTTRFPADALPKDDPLQPNGPQTADGPWEMMTQADRDLIMRLATNGYKATGAYVRKLISGNAPIDRYIMGDTNALSAAAKRGLKLFIGKAGCDNCHTGVTMTDQKFHTIGVPQMGDHVTPLMKETGHFKDFNILLSTPYNSLSQWGDDHAFAQAKYDSIGDMPMDSDKGLFRTKNLRSISKTGPYMHTGAYATLEDVVAFYNKGGEDTGFQGTKDPKIVPLNLTAAEQADLVTFLKEGLLGDPIPDALQADTSKPHL